jgi:hypothetical protein
MTDDERIAFELTQKWLRDKRSSEVSGEQQPEKAPRLSDILSRQPARTLDLHCYFCGAPLTVNGTFCDFYAQEQPPYPSCVSCYRGESHLKETK